MSIAPILKVTVCGPLKEKDIALVALQELGCVHIIPLRDPGVHKQILASDQRRANDALHFLNDTAGLRRPLTREDRFDVNETVEKIIGNKQQLREVSDRVDFIKERIGNLTPWGPFEFPDPDTLADYKLWFYILPIKLKNELSRAKLPWQIVGRDNTRLFICVVSKDEPPNTLFSVPRVRTGAKSIEKLKEDLEDAEIELEDIRSEREMLTRYRLLLAANLARAEDKVERDHTALITHDDGELFVLQGWTPKSNLSSLTDFSNSNGLALILEEPAADEKPPTLLDNPESYGGASDLTLFYQTPGYRDWDPSFIVFVSFAIFFAMILSDAGYALVLATILALYWNKLGKNLEGIRFRNLFLAIALVSIIYGVLVGGYFGLSPPADSLLGKFVFIDVHDFASMMRISIIIGVLHISIANAYAAWLDWDQGIPFDKLGWITATFGGLLIWMGSMTSIAYFGWLLVVAGLAAVFYGNARIHPIKTRTDYLWSGLSGLQALTKITKLFGDVLSYLRLFALGLASASLAATFNELALQLREALPGMGILLALIVLVFGHIITLALGILSGVVHGLRLNFIEFFGWGLSEEGYPFKAFARKESSV